VAVVAAVAAVAVVAVVVLDVANFKRWHPRRHRQKRNQRSVWFVSMRQFLTFVDRVGTPTFARTALRCLNPRTTIPVRHAADPFRFS